MVRRVSETTGRAAANQRFIVAGSANRIEMVVGTDTAWRERVVENSEEPPDSFIAIAFRNPSRPSWFGDDVGVPSTFLNAIGN